MLKLISRHRLDYAADVSIVDYNVGNASKRLDWVDAARGIGISVVIFAHVIVSLRDAHLLLDVSFWNYVAFAIFTFAMPVFMLLAGLFVQRRLQSGTVAFLRPMGITIIWPYVLWGSVALIAEFLGRDLRSPVDTSSVDITLLWTPIAWLWFLWALGVYHMIAAAIGRFPVILIVISVAVLLADGLTSLPRFVHQMAHFLVFYAFGVAFGQSMIRFILPLRVGICAAILFVPLTWSAMAVGPDPWSLTATGAAITGTIAIVVASQALRSKTLLLFLGRRSMPLYVNHIFFIAAIRIALERGLGVTHEALIIPACLVAAFCGPLLLLWLAERWNMVALMGLGRPIVE